MFFIKENFDTSSFLPYPSVHFFAARIELTISDWLEYKRGGTYLLLILIAFLLTFRISFLNTVFSLSVIYFANFPTATRVDFTPSYLIYVNKFPQAMTFYLRSFLSSASINPFSPNTISNITCSVRK